jgi:hypothetical protein
MSMFPSFLKSKFPHPDFEDDNQNQAASYLQVIVFISLCGVVAEGISYALVKRWEYAFAMLLAVCCCGTT